MLPLMQSVVFPASAQQAKQAQGMLDRLMHLRPEAWQPPAQTRGRMGLACLQDCAMSLLAAFFDESGRLLTSAALHQSSWYPRSAISGQHL